MRSGRNMIEVKVTKDTLIPAIEDVVKTWEDKKTAALVKGGSRALMMAAQLTTERLKKPGSYLQSFVVDVVRGKEMRLKNVHHAARILELGTRRKGYRIPRSGEGLWFFKEGVWKWRPYVIHPGIDAKKIIMDTIQKVMPEVMEELKKLLKTEKGG